MGRTTKPGEREREIIIEPIEAPEQAPATPNPEPKPAPTTPEPKREKVSQKAIQS